MADLQAALLEKIAALRVDWHNRLGERTEELRSVSRGLCGGDGEGDLAALRQRLHSLAGSAGTFGQPDLGAQARVLERVAETMLADGAAATTAQIADLCHGVDRLTASMQRIATGAPGSFGLAMASIAKTSRDGRTGEILIVEDDLDTAEELRCQLVAFGYTVQTFASPTGVLETVALGSTAALLVDVHLGKDALAGPRLVAELRAAGHVDVPAVFVSVRDDFDARLAAVRAGANGYVTKPIDAADLVTALDGLTGNERREPFRVLLVDDDALLLAANTLALQQAGMSTRALTSPATVLDEIADFDPDVLLLDMYMPDATGSEVASVVRQIDTFAGLAIVFLSTEDDPARQAEAMRMGADDFISKPIGAMQLVTEIEQRAARHRSLRRLTLRDGLTGLLNRDATRERLIA